MVLSKDSMLSISFLKEHQRWRSKELPFNSSLTVLLLAVTIVKLMLLRAFSKRLSTKPGVSFTTIKRHGSYVPFICMGVAREKFVFKTANLKTA